MSSKLPFRVVYSSSCDEGYTENELEVHNQQTRGWQSGRWCEFPQTLVLRLAGKAVFDVKQIQILSHQSKISKKIDIFVGNTDPTRPSDGGPDDWRSAKFKRLGFLSLNSNERSNFRARELKSVYVDTRGLFLKFQLHESHVNSINLFNQVGIIALNILGNKVDKNSPDDIQFDFQYDPKTAAEIRDLTAAKQQAVIDEDYDEAKRLKMTIDNLKRVGAHLAKLEKQKQIAIEKEDYDQAKRIKMEMEHLRSRGDSLQQQPPAHRSQYQPHNHSARHSAPPEQHFSPEPQSPEPAYGFDDSPPSQPDFDPPDSAHNDPPPQPFDERPLPTQQHRAPAQDISAIGPESVPQSFDDAPLPNGNFQRQVQQERPLPTHHAAANREDDRVAVASGKADEDNPFGVNAPEPTQAGQPEKLSAALRKELQPLVDVFGMHCVRCLHSKTWNLRDTGLKEVRSKVDTDTSIDSKTLFRLACRALKKALADRVAQVFLTAMELFQTLIEQHTTDMTQDGVSQIVRPLIAVTIDKLGGSNARVRDRAQTMLLFLARHAMVGPATVTTILLKPLKNYKLPLPVKGRANVLEQLLPEFKFSARGGMTLPEVMELALEALNHKNGDVRDVGVKLCGAVYSVARHKIVEYLADVKPAMKEVLNAEFGADILEAGQGQGGVKRAKTKPKPKPKPAAAPKKRQAKPKRTKSKPSYEEDDFEPEPTKLSARHAEAELEQASPRPEDDDVDSDPAVCQFCGWRDQQFADNEEELDLHFWQACPMLTACPHCEQVVEVAMLTRHILDECEFRDKVHQCPRCEQPIPAEEFDAHVAAKQCKPTLSAEEASRCPLCSSDIEPGEEGWRQHLLNNGGCLANNRQLPPDFDQLSVFSRQ